MISPRAVTLFEGRPLGAPSRGPVSRLIDDYAVETSFDGERVWEFRLTPKPEAAVVWGHVEYVVRQDDLMPLSARYYDEDGKLARTMVFSDFKKMGGRLVPR